MSTQLSKSDIETYAGYASTQQILRKVKVGDLNILLSVEDDHTLDISAYEGLDSAVYADKLSLTGKLKAKNIALSTNDLTLGDGAKLDTAGEAGQPFTSPAIGSNGTQGHNGKPGGYVYLFVNDFSGECENPLASTPKEEMEGKGKPVKMIQAVRAVMEAMVVMWSSYTAMCICWPGTISIR